MPRDLEAITKEDGMEGMPELTKTPEAFEHNQPSMTAEDEDAMINALSERNEKRDELHPYVQSLKLSDVESCVRLEEETFPPQERCSREKVSSSCSFSSPT